MIWRVISRSISSTFIHKQIEVHHCYTISAFCIASAFLIAAFFAIEIHRNFFVSTLSRQVLSNHLLFWSIWRQFFERYANFDSPSFYGWNRRFLSIMISLYLLVGYLTPILYTGLHFWLAFEFQSFNYNHQTGLILFRNFPIIWNLCFSLLVGCLTWILRFLSFLLLFIAINAIVKLFSGTPKS